MWVESIPLHVSVEQAFLRACLLSCQERMSAWGSLWGAKGRTLEILHFCCSSSVTLRRTWLPGDWDQPTAQSWRCGPHVQFPRLPLDVCHWLLCSGAFWERTKSHSQERIHALRWMLVTWVACALAHMGMMGQSTSVRSCGILFAFSVFFQTYKKIWKNVD